MLRMRVLHGPYELRICAVITQGLRGRLADGTKGLGAGSFDALIVRFLGIIQRKLGMRKFPQLRFLRIFKL